MRSRERLVVSLCIKCVCAGRCEQAHSFVSGSLQESRYFARRPAPDTLPLGT